MGHVHYILEDLRTMTTELSSEFCYMQWGTCTKDNPKAGVFITGCVYAHIHICMSLFQFCLLFF